MALHRTEAQLAAAEKRHYAGYAARAKKLGRVIGNRVFLTEGQLTELDRRPRREPTGTTPSPVVSRKRPFDWGPVLWDKLHRWAVTADLAAAPAWLTAFSIQVRQDAGCSCRSEWDAWVKANPPDLSNHAALCHWTWLGHDAVNAKLRKPRLTYAELCPRYGWPTPAVLTTLRVAVALLYTPEIAEYGKLAEANRKAYSDRHGYTLAVERVTLDTGRHPAWGKIKMVRHLLDDFDAVLWADADALIMNPAIRVESLLVAGADLVMATDSNWYNAGIFLVRSTPASKQFFDDVWNHSNHHFHNGHEWWEQAAIHDLLRADPRRITVREPQSRGFNSIVNQGLEDAYKPGDFIIHFANADRRAERMRDAYAQTIT